MEEEVAGVVADVEAALDRAAATATRSRALAAAAGEAFLVGDLDAASAVYLAAGDAMRELVSLADKARERDFVRLLVAAEYFKGGHFAKADNLLARIKPARNRPEVRAVYRKFLSAVRERLAPGYRNLIADAVAGCERDRRYADGVALLLDHPWALTREDTRRVLASFAVLGGLVAPPEEVADVIGFENGSTIAVGTDAPPGDRIRGCSPPPDQE